ncbi:MAG: aminotransferase class I/II-fold pyridoxal phosphate-dependent enzyme [Acidimicrobiia bacterium]
MSSHMTPEEFRRQGHAAVDWLADYFERIDSLPVMANVEPGEIASMLPETAPEAPEPFESLLSDLDDVVLPGITNWQSPNWFAYFPANSSPPSVLAELVSAGLGAQGMLWSTSPALTEIEGVVLDWLVDLMGLPKTWKMSGPGGGVIQMSASDATHTILAVVRHQRSANVHAEDMVVYVSNQAHFSIQKGCTVAGIGHCRLVDVDDEYAMDVDALSAAIEADVAAGLTPIAVVSAVGTTGTTAVDPIDEISEIAERNGLWHHVDAAYAGTAMLCEEFRVHQQGLEHVDSYTFNPHKWMMVNFDCNVLWVADREPLLDTLSMLPPIMRNAATDAGVVVDYRDWHVPLGRRFRALKLWWVIRSYGAEGLRAFVRLHVQLAGEFAEWIDSDSRFERIAPHPFGLVCFVHIDGNDATRALASAVNDSGRAAVTVSELNDVAFIRVSIGQTYTDSSHVAALEGLIDKLA